MTFLDLNLWRSEIDTGLPVPRWKKQGVDCQAVAEDVFFRILSQQRFLSFGLCVLDFKKLVVALTDRQRCAWNFRVPPCVDI